MDPEVPLAETPFEREAGIKRLISRQLVGVVFALPETAAREAHVPVAEVGIHELGNGATRTGGLIAAVSVVHFEDEGVEFRENPTIDFGTLLDVDVGSGVVELVDVGIQGEEGVGVVEGAEELAAHFVDTSFVEFQVVPRLRVGNHVPTHGVGTILLDGTERVDGIAQAFGHLVAVLVKHQVKISFRFSMKWYRKT